MTPEEFNHLSSSVVPVLTNARPYGAYSMVDIDRMGGVQVIVRELLETGLLNGDVMTCTGRTLAEQVADLNTPEPDRDVIYPVEAPYKLTGGLRVLGGNLSPDFSAILKLAGVEGGLEDNFFRGNARIFEGEADLLTALDKNPGSFRNHDMVVVRYEGPSGAPGMPEMLDPNLEEQPIDEKSASVTEAVERRDETTTVNLLETPAELARQKSLRDLA